MPTNSSAASARRPCVTTCSARTTAAPWTITRKPSRTPQAAVTRIATFQRRARTQLANTASDVPKPPIAFAAALDDDLNVPAALAVLHDHVRAGNIALDNGDAAAVMSAYESVLAMTEVLGAEPGGHDRPASRRAEQHDLYPRRGPAHRIALMRETQETSPPPTASGTNWLVLGSPSRTTPPAPPGRRRSQLVHDGRIFPVRGDPIRAGDRVKRPPDVEPS